MARFLMVYRRVSGPCGCVTWALCLTLVWVLPGSWLPFSAFVAAVAVCSEALYVGFQAGLRHSRAG